MEKSQAHTTTAPGLMIFEKPQGVMGVGYGVTVARGTGYAPAHDDESDCISCGPVRKYVQLDFLRCCIRV